MKFTYSGLTDADVEASRRQHGTNAITPQARETFWDKLVGNLKDPIIIILIVALVVTIVLAVFGYAEWYEGVGIAIAVALATLVATWSEYSNETAFQKLLEEASLVRVKVFRNSRLVEIPIDELVVGDYLLLQPGDTVPTDGVLAGGHLEVSQAALTGESEPVRKQAAEQDNPAADAEESHKLYRASLVQDGEAVLTVTAVGDQTQYGRTLREILTAEDRLSPLQSKLTVLGKHISTFGYIGATLIALAFMLNKVYLGPDAAGALDLYLAQKGWGGVISDMVTALILAIIIIVVAVPEGLPMMIAIVLSLNMKKLLNAKVLVRKLLGIETAGSLTVLFSDKTGTLTQGRLSVAALLDGTGQGYGQMDELPAPLADALAFALRHNTSAVVDTSGTEPRIVGANSTEKALLLSLGSRLATQGQPDIREMIPFSSARKFSAVEVGNGRHGTLVKGAPEIVLAHCTHYLDATGAKQPLDGTALETAMSALAARAMRLIAVAVSDAPLVVAETPPDNLTLVTVLGLRDELRTESYSAVARAQRAGIQVVMITGDAKETAQAISRDVGLLNIDDAVMLSSAELGQLDDAAVQNLLPRLRVVARAFPTDKSRLVRLAKERGWVVGMTGDGVNDAPAVKNADVGFSMGSGTEMTKESSDIVILDDNFASLTQSVLYGRTLFKSIRKFLVFQLTVNVSAILLAFLGPFLGFDLPLTMVQLLWINIIMDTLAALAFSGEAALERYMVEKPIPKDEPLITREMWSAILVDGIAATLLSLFFLTYPPIRELFHSEAAFLTGFFCFFVFMHNFNKFNARTDSLNLFDHLAENRNFIAVVALIFALQVVFTYIGGEVLRTVGLYPQEWLYVLLLALIIIPVDLARKLVRNRWYGNPTKPVPASAGSAAA